MMSEAMAGRLSDKVRRYMTLKEAKRELEDSVKEMSAAIEAQRKEIITGMLDVSEATGLTLRDFSLDVDGYRFRAAEDNHYSIKADNRDEAFKGLRICGLSELIKEVVDPRTLSKVMREHEDEDGELPEHLRALPLERYPVMDLKQVKVGKR